MIAVPFLLLLSALHAAPQETRPVPAGSVEVGSRGCLSGRVFTATRPESDDVTLGPSITGWSFRLAGPRELLDQVSKYNGNLVEVTGLVQESEFTRPRQRSGSGVTMSAPRTDPTRKNVRNTPVGGLPVMDLTAVRYLSAGCPIG
jgi:hypothetical protein